MGLYLTVTGTLHSQGLLRRKPGPKNIFPAIRDAIPSFFEDPLERKLVSGSGCGDALSLNLHPAEEPVEIQIPGDGRLEVSAKTSSAGPGYHAMVVEFLDHLASEIGIDWHWMDGEAEPADETSYHGHRDFEKLRLAMADQLKAVADLLLEDDDLNHIGLSVPHGFTALGDHYAISPLGFWQKDWFERLAAQSSQDCFGMAAEFYPCWSNKRDARFWFNCGSVLCWMDLPWHRPTEKDLEAKYQLALDCFARAKQLDPALPLPEAEMEEIEEILESDGFTRVPKPDGIGFRRRLMRRDLTGEWSVDLPGYFYEELEQEGETLVYWFDQRAVRGSSLSIRTNDPDGAENGGQVFVEKFKQSMEGKGESFEFQNDHISGWACETRTEEPDESYWNLMGAIGFGGSVCVVTITYEDPRTDRDWALEVMGSVSCPKS